jgi:hypothetical protein
VTERNGQTHPEAAVVTRSVLWTISTAAGSSINDSARRPLLTGSGERWNLSISRMHNQ